MGKSHKTEHVFFRPLLSHLIAFLMCFAPSIGYCQVSKQIEAGLTVEIEGGREIFMRACPATDCDTGEWATRILATPEVFFGTNRCAVEKLEQRRKVCPGVRLGFGDNGPTEGRAKEQSERHKRNEHGAEESAGHGGLSSNRRGGA